MSVAEMPARKVVRGRSRALSPKQLKFCDEYVNDPSRNARQCAIRAGYSPKTAAEQASILLTLPKVNTEITRLERDAGKLVNLTPQTIVQNLFEDRRLALERGNINAAIRADELLGKHAGMFTERVEITENRNVHVTVRHDLARLTEQELNQLETLLGRASEVIDVEAKPKEITGENEISE